jgi:hypothetical protein
MKSATKRSKPLLFGDCRHAGCSTLDEARNSKFEFLEGMKDKHEGVRSMHIEQKV